MAVDLTGQAIQAALDAAANQSGDNKYIELKTGETNLDRIVTCRKDVSIFGPGAIFHTTTPYYFLIPDGAHNVDIVGLTGIHDADETEGYFVRVGGGSTTTVLDWSVQHCKLYGYGFVYGGVFARGKTRGLFRKSYVANTKNPSNRGFGYGIVVDGDYIWVPDASHLVGTLAGVTVEDCEFLYCRHCIAANRAAVYVFRKNYCHKLIISSAVDMHGGYLTQCGTVFADVYDNLIEDPLDPNQDGPANTCIGPRGGMSTIHNNRIKGYRWPIAYTVERSNMEPAEALKYKPYKSYEWGNTCDSGKGAVIQFNDLARDNIIVGRDVFFNTPYPGYVAPVYPHPRAIDLDGPTPPAPLKGDINEDGKVNTADITALEQIIAEGGN